MNLDFIKFNEQGLVPAVVQTASDGRVVMVAWMNRESLAKSIETGLMHYWSRSRGKLWLKGESSGNTQRILRWFADCDNDTLLFEIEQKGGACHTGYRSCFYQQYDSNAQPVPIEEKPLFDPDEVYKK